MLQINVFSIHSSTVWENQPPCRFRAPIFFGSILNSNNRFRHVFWLLAYSFLGGTPSPLEPLKKSIEIVTDFWLWEALLPEASSYCWWFRNPGGCTSWGCWFIPQIIIGFISPKRWLASPDFSTSIRDSEEFRPHFLFVHCYWFGAWMFHCFQVVIIRSQPAGWKYLIWLNLITWPSVQKETTLKIRGFVYNVF